MATIAEIARAVEQSTDPDVVAAFPDYLRHPLPIEIGFGTRAWFAILHALTQAFVWLILRPRREPAGALDPAEVDRVYQREARDYDWKHHVTTRGQDTHWRRIAGWLVASAPEQRPAVLDLCTGTGLTVVEMLRVLREHRKGAAITGLDFNAAMLHQARQRLDRIASENPDHSITFVRGDATALLAPAAPGFTTFDAASFDIVTQVFGIGGLDDPVAVFASVLDVLHDQGRFLLIDMHRPIANLPGEMPVLANWLQMPRLEAHVFHNTTLPLPLARLWGWRDPTLDFYLAPLVCAAKDGAYHGFRILWKTVESERWWLSFPVMPTCRILLEKIQIDRAEYERRQRVLSSIGVGK